MMPMTSPSVRALERASARKAAIPGAAGQPAGTRPRGSATAGPPLGDGPAAGDADDEARCSGSRTDSVGRAGAGGSTPRIGEPAGATPPFERTRPSATTSDVARIQAILRARGERPLRMSVN